MEKILEILRYKHLAKKLEILKSPNMKSKFVSCQAWDHSLSVRNSLNSMILYSWTKEDEILTYKNSSRAKQVSQLSISKNLY